jgi:hypothetical protein
VRKDILPYYRALGLSPGAEAIEIKRAYRQMIQQWHPDLYKPGSPMQTTAEDITKEINEAYEQLYRKKLYRNFLPKSEAKAKPDDVPRKEAGPAEPEPARKKAHLHSERSSAGGWIRIEWGKLRTRAWKLRASRWTKAAGAMSALGVVVFGGRELLEAYNRGAHDAPIPRQASATLPSLSHPDGAGSFSSAPAPVRIPVATAAVSYTEPELSRFRTLTSLEAKTAAEADNALIMDRAGALLDVIELGDSKARVKAVQGAPDETSDALFRYGSSVVYFKDGRVTAWRNRLPRLRVRDWSANMLPTLDRFSMGSSRGDVVRAQGLPAAFDATTFTYGSSVVSFERGQVSGWNDGDVRLQHFDMPTLPFFDLDHLAFSDAEVF